MAIVYELTGSEAALGAVVAALGLPGLVITLFGGALGDRLEKKTILQVSQALLAVVGLFLALSIRTGTITWLHLLAASFVYGSILAFFWPVRQALIPQVVSRDLVMNAAALNSMAMSIMTLVGPAVGGVVIAFFGIESLFYAIVGLHLGAAILVARLPKQREERVERRPPILVDILDGLRYARANTVILLLLVLGFTQMTMMVPIRFAMPIFAKDVFGAGPEGLGLLMSAMGIGSLGGSLFVASMGRVERRGLILGITGIASGALVLVFSIAGHFVPSLILGLAILAVMGLVQSGRMSLQNSLVMEYVDAQYRGRVMSIHALGWSMMPVGVLPLSMLMARIGAPAGMGSIALVFVVVLLIAVVLSPRLRAFR